MRTLGAWIGATLTLVIGVGVGHLCPRPEHAAALVVLSIVLAVVTVAVGLANGDRGQGGWLVAALWLAVLARGVDAGAREHAGVREGHRGSPSGLRDLEVVGASVPGPRCNARVRVIGQDTVAWLALPPERCPLAHGDRLRVVAAALQHPVGPLRPGAASPDDAALAAGADVGLQVDDAWPGPAVRPGAASIVARFIAEQRERAWIDSRGDEARGFVAAAVLGVRSALPAARRAELRASGLGHLVAVSGLHVGLAAWLAFVVFVRVLAGAGGGLGLGVAVALALLILYVVLTGGAASAVRAGIMAGIVALGMLCGRPHHGLTTLAVACGVMLVVRPAWMFDPGFQMSAAAMAAVVGAPSGSGILMMTWRVTWAIAPISLAHFETVSGWGMLGNLLAIPVVTLWVLPLGILGWMLTPIVGPVAWDPAAAGGGLVLDLAAGLARLPPVPVHAVLVVAALAVLGWPLGRWLCRRGLEVWPPLVFVIPTLVAAIIVARPRPEPACSWVAFGDPRNFMLVAIDSEGRVCVERARGDAEATLRTLAALGGRSLGAVTPSGDPAGAALVAFAESAGWDVDATPCAMPDVARVRQVLRACDVRRFADRVAGEDADGNPRCYKSGVWRDP